jgi:glucan phosphoethanolaminetransferase (alkaline phosphatase superfamily)
MLWICAIPFIVAAFGAVTAVMGKSAYKWFTAEDGFSENLQVVFWLMTFILCFFIMRQEWRSGDRLIAVLYGVLSVAVFFLIGEELSWGQRIFGWATSEEFAAINKQHETNIHNIHGIGDAFKWVHVVIGAYGALLPLLFMRIQVSRKDIAERIPKLVPHITFLPFFAVPLVWRLYANLIEPPERFKFVVAEYSEVIELILAIGFFLFMVFQLRKANKLALLTVAAQR